MRKMMLKVDFKRRKTCIMLHREVSKKDHQGRSPSNSWKDRAGVTRRRRVRAVATAVL